MAIINDILDFSRMEAKKLTLERVEFGLRDVLDETFGPLAPQAFKKGLDLVCDVRPNVPERVLGDPTRLRQIVTNLVGNAIKFTAEGEVLVRAETEFIEPPGVVLHFTVTDTGIGIPKEKQQLIFEAFAQADGSSTREFGGTGLGLSISRDLVEMMGGRMWVDSEAGKGSTFHFTAPLGLGEAVALPTFRPPASLANLPVLVVDDNSTNRRILAELLTRWGMIPQLVGSGAEALDDLRRSREAGRPYSLVITDAQMPQMDGFALVEHMKVDPSLTSPTIIMLSSAGQGANAARCRELGVSTYLMKPIRPKELRDAILRVLEGRELRSSRPSPGTPQVRKDKKQGLSILLAEDNPDNQAVAVRMLERQGHSVAVAANGREALAALERAGDSFHLALIDIQMPEMNGYELTAAIREKEKRTASHLPIIAVTAHAMAGDRGKCLAAGMDDYLAKPIRAAELSAAIKRVLPFSI